MHALFLFQLGSFPENCPISKSGFPQEITARLAIETGTTVGWERWVGSKGAVIGIDHYGASAPAEILYKQFGFTVETVVTKVKELVRKR